MSLGDLDSTNNQTEATLVFRVWIPLRTPSLNSLFGAGLKKRISLKKTLREFGEAAINSALELHASAGETAIPTISQLKSGLTFSEDEYSQMTARLMSLNLRSESSGYRGRSRRVR